MGANETGRWQRRLRRGPYRREPAQISDTNHDGKVSRDEFAKIVQLFDAVDKNHDGSLTAEELGGFYQVAAQAPAQATGGVDVDAFFAKYDKNKDGKITPDELDNEKLFKALDLNHDG